MRERESLIGDSGPKFGGIVQGGCSVPPNQVILLLLSSLFLLVLIHGSWEDDDGGGGGSRIVTMVLSVERLNCFLYLDLYLYLGNPP